MLIRSVELRDVDAITDIYNGYVTGGSATFETEPVGTAEMRSRIAGISARFPYLDADQKSKLHDELTKYLIEQNEFRRSITLNKRNRDSPTKSRNLR